MTYTYSNISTLNADVAIKTRGNVTTYLPKQAILVPTTIINFRGRFATLPELLPTLLSKNYKPALLSTIDIEIPTKKSMKEGLVI